MGDESKREYIKGRLKTDPLAVDFQWSLLVAALSSYRHDTVLRPFPPLFQKDADESSESRDFPALEKAIDRLPYIGIFLEAEDCKKKADSELVDLVYWLLKKPFQLKFCDKEKYAEIQELAGQTVQVPPPNYTFEVVYDAAVSAKFDGLRGDRDLMYAFHGSRLENFHSILHFGLQGHLSKNALFGEGTYLSAELSICLNYAPTGKAWEKSLLGQKLSCVAVCEIIDDPAVKCQVKEAGNARQSRSRSSVSGSLGGEVPEKYYVVRNNDVMRLKYLLVYAEKSKPKSSFRQSAVHWCLHHKYVLIIVLYALILLSVGLYNSKSFHQQLRKYLRR